jgi:hypothetical protein
MDHAGPNGGGESIVRPFCALKQGDFSFGSFAKTGGSLLAVRAAFRMRWGRSLRARRPKGRAISIFAF